MTARLRWFSRIGRYCCRPSVVAAGIAIAVTFATGFFAELQNRAVHHERERAAVGERLASVRAKLEGNISNNIQLVRGLVAVIKIQPDIDQTRFSEIAASLVGAHSQLRNIAAAPDLVISLMHPIKGNEKAIGLDYRKNEKQRDAALRAVKSREMVLAGPINLLQGGQGFIGRFPVFIGTEGASEKLWGIVSAVIDVERLYTVSGLRADELPIKIAIAGQDASGSKGEVFYGPGELLNNDPVIADVSLPGGSWQMAATPRGGWSVTPPNTWHIRLLILAGGLLVVLPISIAGHLYDQRRASLKELGLRDRQMRRLSQRLTLALRTSKIGVWELNLDTGKLVWDSRMRELYDLHDDFGELSVENWKAALHPDDLGPAEAEFEEAISTNGTYHSEFRVRDRNGGVRWIRAMGAINREAGGGHYILGVNWDVSDDIQLRTHLLAAKRNAELRNRELEDARALMERNSLHDSLTGLPNRRFVDQRLIDGFDGAPVTALLHIDLDRFKHINDTLGHAAGDAMLIHAASVLKSCTRPSDFIARIGGDEFVVATTTPTGEPQLSAIANRIIDAIRQPVPYGNHECRFGVSIGIAFADAEQADYGKRLLIDADIALYRAKNSGRNRFEFFTDSLKAEIIRNKTVADDILNGLERGEFLPYFQPQFDSETLEVVGVEALARWQHPSEGLLAPDAFLKTADELNVVHLIDRAVLEQSLFQAKRWEAANITIPKISVNVSSSRFNDAGLIESLESLSFKPGTLSFELLESVFLDDRDEAVMRNIERLKALGIDIEIDDFGSGYASIVSLIQVRPGRLKIDRRLVKPIVDSDSQRRLAASIIEIGHSLKIEVIAEGVETMEHAAILRDLGCETLQGYALARPMTSARLIEFMSQDRIRHVA